MALLRRGLAESHCGELKALQTLAAALESLQAKGDAGGAALAAAGLLVTGQCMHSYRRFAERAGALSGLREGSIACADHGDALIAHAGPLCSLLLLSPSDPFFPVLSPEPLSFRLKPINFFDCNPALDLRRAPFEAS